MKTKKHFDVFGEKPSFCALYKTWRLMLAGEIPVWMFWLRASPTVSSHNHNQPWFKYPRFPPGGMNCIRFLD